MRPAAWVGALVALSLPIAAAEEVRPPPAVAVAGLEEVVLADTGGVALDWQSGPKVALAPDGRTVAFLRANATGRYEPWVVRPGEDPRRVADGDFVHPVVWGGILRFTADSTRLLIVRGIDADGDGAVVPDGSTGDHPFLSLVDLATHEAVWTSARDRFALFPSLGGGTLVHVEVASLRPLGGVRLVRTDLATLVSTVVQESPTTLPIFGAVSPRGDLLACWLHAAVGPDPGTDLGVFDLADGTLRTHLAIGLEGRPRVDFPLRWTGNGRAVYYTADRGSVRRIVPLAGRVEEVDADAHHVAALGDRFMILNHRTRDGPSIAADDASGAGMVELVAGARALDATPAGRLLYERDGRLCLVTLSVPPPLAR